MGSQIIVVEPYSILDRLECPVICVQWKVVRKIIVRRF